MIARSSVTALGLTVVLAAAPLHSQQVQGAPAHDSLMLTAAAGLQWAPIAPPGFDKGMEIAVVRGDPSKAGEPYVIRLRFPAGYRFPAHWHPVPENLTVLEGEFLLAMGEKLDESQLGQVYRPGDFIYAEPKKPHFGGARVPTTIQLHGLGPFAIIVVGSPEDIR